MKKFFIAAVILCLLLFVACGAQSDPTVQADQPSQNVSEPEQQTTIADNANEDTTEAAKKIRGTIDGNSYRNEFIGLGIALDDTWTFYTDEQIAALYGLTADRAGEDWASLIEAAPIVYDMYAVAANQVDNININLEKSDASLLESFDIPKNFEKWSNTIRSSYENMGYSGIEMKIGTTEIDGQTFDSMNVTASAGALQVYQTMVAYICEDYIVTITFTALSEAAVADMLGSVSLLDSIKIL